MNSKALQAKTVGSRRTRPLRWPREQTRRDHDRVVPPHPESSALGGGTGQSHRHLRRPGSHPPGGRGGRLSGAPEFARVRPSIIDKSAPFPAGGPHLRAPFKSGPSRQRPPASPSTRPVPDFTTDGDTPSLRSSTRDGPARCGPWHPSPEKPGNQHPIPAPTVPGSARSASNAPRGRRSTTPFPRSPPRRT